MSDTHHHNKRRWFDGSRGRGYMGHAPAWFRLVVAMSAPGADPLAAIRPVCRECGVTTGGGEFCYQHAPYTVWPLKDGTFRVDRNGRKRVEPVEPPASQWDTRESALRALVAQWREEIGGDPLDRFDDGWVAAKGGCIEQLERLISGPQP